ncbi:MAG: 3-phosphoshikimate 1-carboxyvinyltransferase [Solirubrobacterales bacterium]
MTLFEPSGALRGALRPPPDKSISHRAALLGAMAEGHSVVDGYLDAADTRSTLAAIEALGAEVQITAEAEGRLDLRIEGRGLRSARSASIDVGNAGTLLRILPGWLAGQDYGNWTLDGDASIRSRPVDRIAEPLLEMGASVTCRGGRLPPLELEAARLHGIDYELPVASAQVKSCLLLAGLLAKGETTVIEPLPTRDHTERLLAGMGAELRREGNSISVAETARLEGVDIEVPGDFSSAAFPLVAGLLVPASEIELAGVGLNRTRIGMLPILARMGVEMAAAGEGGEPSLLVDGIRDAGPEPLGTLRVRHSKLRGVSVSAEEVPPMIDELPLVALLGCFADGETVVAGAEELRHKESDRIAAVVEALDGLGAEIEARPDGFAVRGTGGLGGGTLDARGDHRIAMLGAVAGVASREGVEVEGFGAAAVSYPGFERDLRSLLG